MAPDEIHVIDENSGAVQRGRYLSFALGEEEFGIEISAVTEIIGMQPITRLPEVPDYIKGIINLRGKIIPVIDMRLRFDKKPAEYNDRTCIIVVELQDIVAGLIVDNVTEVLSIGGSEIVATPHHSSTGIQNRYVSGIGNIKGQVRLLLDCAALLQDEEPEKHDNVGSKNKL